MGLEARLRRLRGLGPPIASPPVASPLSSPGSPAPSVPERPSLAERRSRRAPWPRCAGVPDEQALAERLGAEVLRPGVLYLERRLDLRLRHGRAPLGLPVEPRYIPMPADRGPAGQASPWVCFDTETSGLAGGTGTWAFLTGLLCQAGPGWVLRQLLLTRLDTEAAYLAAVAAALAPPLRLLSYNGKAFDAPLLAIRLRLAGLANPLIGLPHLDLLGPVRRAFTHAWPDCRLATAESRLLGLERRDDLPGSAVPLAWLGWLRRGEMDPLARVLRHNRLDLYSLAGLLPRVDAAYADPAAQGADPRAVAAAHREQGRRDLALEILARHRRSLGPGGLLDLAALYRRTGQWAQALAIWEPLEAAGDLQARGALARYHEHRSRDLARALALVEGLPSGPDRERRRARLLARRQRLACLSLDPPPTPSGA